MIDQQAFSYYQLIKLSFLNKVHHSFQFIKMQGSTTISSTSLVACYHSTEQKLATAQQQTVGKTDLDQKLDKKVQ